MVYKCSFHIYYEDTDLSGFVYHARYLAFAERARAEALKEASMPLAWLLQEKKLAFVVHKLSITYKVPLRIDDIFTIETSFMTIKGARMEIQQDIYKSSSEETILSASLQLTLACIDTETSKLKKIPDWFSKKIIN